MKKILIIEDDALLIDILKILLQDIAVLNIAKNYQEAVSQLKSDKIFHLIIIDWKLYDKPDAGKVLLLSIKKSIRRTVPIIATTAYYQDSIKTFAINNGVNYFIIKPFDIRVFKMYVLSLIQ